MVLALAAVPMAMAAGFGIDYSRAMTLRAQLQAALDAGVLAGAKDGSTAWTTVARNTFSGAVPQGVTIAASAFALDTDGNYGGTASGTLDSSFSGLLSYTSLELSVAATAVRPVTGNKVCILLNSTTASPGLLLNGGANLNAPDCQVDVRSTGNPAATFNSNTVFATKKTCVAGTNILDNGGSHASLAKGCTTTTDPFAGTLPVPSSASCTFSGLNFNGGNVTLSPGVYCYGINFNGTTTLTLNPGVYVLKSGNWNFNGGSMTGNGVSFYFADSSYIQFNGTTSLNLAAPTSGTYANLLLYEAQGLASSSFTVNATSGAALSGLIWLPSRNLTLNAGASATSNNLTMVLNTLIMNTVNWTIASSDKTITSAGSSAATSGIYLKR
jgi:Flp pilus assembly protein TadG